MSSICRAKVDVIDKFENPAIIALYNNSIIIAAFRCQLIDCSLSPKYTLSSYKQSRECANVLGNSHVLMKKRKLLYREILATSNAKLHTW